MTPSPYQEKVLKAVRLAKSRRDRDEQSNIVINSVAGSGKSTTGRLVVTEYKNKYPGDNALVLAFNVHIVEAMKEKLANVYGVDIETTHRAGLRTLKENGYSFNKFQIKGSKYFYIARDIIEKESRADFISAYKIEEKPGDVDNPVKIKRLLRRAASQLTELTSKVMISMVDASDYNAVRGVIERFSIECNEICIRYVHKMVSKGLEMVRNKTLISFDDMLVAPIVLKCKFKRYKLVVGDEIQDWSQAQLQLVKRFSQGATVAGFGDRNQAIMAFSGSLSDSIDQFESVFDTRAYNLPVSYRCDKAILELARILVPHILDRDDAGDGVAEMIDYNDIARKAMPGDFVICRLTAPLVSCCIGFIRLGKAARIKGRDVGFKLFEHYQTVADLYPEAKTVSDFLEVFKEYKGTQISKAIGKKSKETLISLLTDELDSILAVAEYVYDKGSEQSHYGVGKFIKDLFDDNITPEFILLCTGHRSKGAEAKRVFIIEFNKIPFAFKGIMPTGENLKQEVNLIYVMLTRALQELYIARTPECYTIEEVKSKLNRLASTHQCDTVEM